MHGTVKHSLAEIQTGRKSGNGADGDLGPCQITVSLDSEVSNKFLLPLKGIIFSLDKVPFNGCEKISPKDTAGTLKKAWTCLREAAPAYAKPPLRRA